MKRAAQPETDTEVLAGLVERVTFHSQENGFCVLRIKARGRLTQRTNYYNRVANAGRSPPGAPSPEVKVV